MTDAATGEMTTILAQPPAELPLVSVVIPMHNEAPNIRRCVESILNQTYPTERLEVVVVDGISDDGSREILRELDQEYENVHCHDNPLRITPRALNIGVRNSKGDVIIILGAHTKINEDFIALNIEYMQMRGEVCTGGTQINVGDSWLQQAIGAGMASPFGIPTAPYRFERKERYVDTVVYAAYKREVLEEAGLFEEDLHIAEDAELNWRIRQKKHKIFFSPKIVSYYYPRPTLGKLFKQFFNYGLMRVNVIKKHPDAFRLLHLLPAAAIVLGGFLAGMSFFHNAFFYTLLILSGLYVGGLGAGSILTARKTQWKFLPALPSVFSTLHFGFGVGFVVGLFKSRKFGGAIPPWAERTLLVISDAVATMSAFAVLAYSRSEMGFVAVTESFEILRLGLITFVYWFVIFLYTGLYKTWQATSRLDEFIQVFKAVFWGVLVIFLITVDLEKDIENPLPPSRFMIFSYLVYMTAFVGVGRTIIHTFQRKLLELGVGLKRTLIVGWGEKAFDLFNKVSNYPALGYRVVGFAAPEKMNGRMDYQGVPMMGEIAQLEDVLKENKIEEVLIALRSKHRRKIYDIIAATDAVPVKLKVVPDLYSIITGQARTNQIYGIPLIEILPQLMPAWEKTTKRVLDVIISLAILIFGLPFWLLIALIIRLDSPGPIIYSQKRVGQNGREFKVYKFRSMVQDAEKLSGPKWADQNDPRVTRVGKWIRKLRLDEVPQFWNVLKGEMSLVGPRPERPFFVEKLRKEIPLYTRRLRVRPGISGWAQIKGGYDASVEDVKQKLQYDLFYLENMSLRMDLKILLNTIYVVLLGKGR